MTKTNYQRMETVEIVKEFLKERGYKDILDEPLRRKKSGLTGQY